MQLDLLSKNTKSERVKRLLKERGAEGVSNWDLNQISFRYGAIIHNLRKEGCLIDTIKINNDGLYKFIYRGER